MKTFARPFIGGMERVKVPPRPANRGPIAQLATTERSRSICPMAAGPVPVTFEYSRVPARPANLPSAELFDIPMKCAKDGRPQTLRFQRSEVNPKHFFVRQILPCDTAASRSWAGEAFDGHSEPSIVFDDVQCGHCRTPGGTLYCRSCRSLICRGGVTEEENGVSVRCTPSCGSTGFLIVYRTETETVYQDRICIGHVGYPYSGGMRNEVDRVLASRPGRFFDCCGLCDAPKIVSKRRAR